MRRPTRRASRLISRRTRPSADPCACRLCPYQRLVFDPVLSRLCRMLLDRKLFQIRLSTEPIIKSDVEKVKEAISREWKLAKSDAPYLFSHGTVSNEAYLTERNSIQVLMKTGELVDVAQASDLPNIKAMSKIVKKNYLCWPKNLSL